MPSNLLVYIFVLLLLWDIAQSSQVCDLTTNYGMSIGLCKCSPTGVLIDGRCQTCTVSNCLLCSIGSVSECDVCATGYILDQLTKSTCVPKINHSAVCTQNTCTCSAYQVYKDGRCMSCSVANCLLCEISCPDKCDVCHSGFVLDKLTGTECVPIINQTKSCQPQTCGCTIYQVSINNTCVNCSVSNCLLCTVGNQNQCDVCKSGYALDQLTKSICVQTNSMTISCTEKSCGCSPYQVYVNKTCKSCQVKNCTLCAVGNHLQCDICSTGYVLDQLTKTTCVPIVNSNSSLSCTSIACQCAPNQSKVNGVCKSCQVTNCRLCSIDDQKQCDVCQIGYILDALTHSECFPIQQSTKVCQVNQTRCKCSPYQVSINNQCVGCEVANCLLCEVANPQGCDICKKPYTYNPQTLKCDPPVCQINMMWVEDHCECDRNKAFMNSQGKCEAFDYIQQLGLALGIGLPVIFISLAMIALVKITSLSSAGSMVSQDSGKVSSNMPSTSNVNAMQQQFR